MVSPDYMVAQIVFGLAGGAVLYFGADKCRDEYTKMIEKCDAQYRKTMKRIGGK